MNSTRAWIISGGITGLIGVLLLGVLGIASWRAGHARMTAALVGAAATAVIILGGCMCIGALVVRAVTNASDQFQAGVTLTIDRLAQALRPGDDE